MNRFRAKPLDYRSATAYRQRLSVSNIACAIRCLVYRLSPRVHRRQLDYAYISITRLVPRERLNPLSPCNSRKVSRTISPNSAVYHHLVIVPDRNDKISLPQNDKVRSNKYQSTRWPRIERDNRRRLLEKLL